MAGSPRGEGRAGGRAASRARSSRSARRGFGFAPTGTARELFISPEVSMEVQAKLGSDIALVFDECTPYHADRDYTARSTERTHRWLDRCLAWHGENGPRAPGRVRHRPGRRPRGPAARIGAGGLRGRRRRDSRSAARSAATRRRCAAVLRLTAPLLPAGGARSTCSGSARSTTCSPASPSASTSSTAPSRPASPATASPSCPTPSTAFASTCARRAGRATATRWSTAAPAPPAGATTATTSATSPAPRS